MSGFEIVGLVLGIMGLAVTPITSKTSSLFKAAKAQKKARRFLERTENRLSIYSDLFLNECKRLLRPLDLDDEDIEKLFGKHGALDERWKSEVFVSKLEAYLAASMGLFSKTMKAIHQDFEEVRRLLEKFGDIEESDIIPAEKLSFNDRNKILERRDKIGDSLDSLKDWLDLLREEVKRFLDSTDHGTAVTVQNVYPDSKNSLTKRSGWEEIGHRLTDSRLMSARLSDYILRSGCSCHFLNLRLDFRCAANERRRTAFRFLAGYRSQDVMAGMMDIDARAEIALQELEVRVRRIANSGLQPQGSSSQSYSSQMAVSVASSTVSPCAMKPPPIPATTSKQTKRKRVTFVTVAQISGTVSNKFKKVAPTPPPAPNYAATSSSQYITRESDSEEEAEEETTDVNVPVVGSFCITLRSPHNSNPCNYDASPLATSTQLNTCLGMVADPACTAGDGEVKYLLYNRGDRQYPGNCFQNSTLHDVLSRKTEFYARDRLKLAFQLASSLLMLHLRSWMSTNWRSRDVLLLEDNTITPIPGDPPEWLPYTVGDIKTIRSIDNRCRQTQHFQRSYIYSLGVILLEIGRCRPIQFPFENDDDERMKVRDLMYQSAVERDLGPSYKRVVEKCISWHKKAELGDSCSDLTCEEVQKAFYEEIVEQLRVLFEGQCKC